MSRWEFLIKKIINSMSNLIINIRFWYWHLQVGERFCSIKIVKNRHIKTLKDIPYVEVHKFFKYGS